MLRRDAATGTPGRPTRFANSIKYRDNGLKPARGRSGSASLEARALLGRDGRTTLDITTGVIDEANAPGTLSKIQLRQFAPDGALQITSNYNGLSSPVYQLTVPGRVRGSKLQVQGNVVGIDPNRTDVVTLTETVKLRPDLSVDDISAPAQARVSMPVNISALISEQNSDVGARADCVLAVDGVEVDRAHGIWVDAGRSVSCLFNHIFPSTGTKQLTVSAVSVNPGDWDASNNSAVGSIAIVPTVNDFTWFGSYFGLKDWSGTSFSEGWWTRPDVGDRAEWKLDQVMHHSDSWHANVGGHVPAMSGPITFSFHDQIDGAPLNQSEFDPITDIPVFRERTYEDPVVGTVHEQVSCITAYRPEPATIEGQQVMISPVNLLICTWLRSGPSGTLPDQSFTDFNYASAAGDVAYYADHWEKYNDGTPENENGYSFSFTGETDYAFGTVAFGSAYTFTLSITGSEQTRTASGTIPLSAPNVIVVSFPYRCDHFNDPTFVQHSCFAGNYTQTLIAGSASGSPGN